MCASLGHPSHSSIALMQQRLISVRFFHSPPSTHIRLFLSLWRRIHEDDCKKKKKKHEPFSHRQPRTEPIKAFFQPVSHTAA